MDGDWRRYPHAPAPGTELCSLAEIPDGGARVFPFGRGWPGFELLVVREGADVQGYVNLCPHLPLPLNVNREVRVRREHLLCDHHGATFRFADGRCTDGPCRGASLIRVPLVTKEGRVAIGFP